MTDSSRQAALLLHCVGEADRSWLLARLPSIAQERMLAQIKELTELGIPGDPSLINELLGRGKLGKVRPPEAGDGLILRDANVTQITELLQGEPLWLIAALLNANAWEWADDFLLTMDASRRERLRPSLGKSIAPALGKALIKSCEMRLLTAAKANTASQITSARPQGFGVRFRRLVQEWL